MTADQWLIFLSGIVGGALRVGVPFLFVSLGECLTEKSGRINLGLEGVLVMSAMTAFGASYLSGSPWVGVLAAALAGALLATELLATAGAAAALWQHFVAKSSSSCNLTLADRIVSGLQLDALAPEVFAPRASCADAAVDLLGLPYEFWSLGLFAALSAAAIWTLVRLLQR